MCSGSRLSVRFRTFRLAVRFGGAISKYGIRDEFSLFAVVSLHRILRKVLTAPQLFKTALLQPCIPDSNPLIGIDQPPEF